MRAAIYARSSKERTDVSVPSQVEELRALASQRGDAIARVFQDKAESAKTDERPAFQEMMSLAKSKARPFDRIYCYDTSRFSRRREHAAAYKTILKKAGVDLVFLRLPKSDSYVDGIIEGVFEVFDEFHSQKSKADGLRGMRQNAKMGYRAGGAAPFGYRLAPAHEGVNAEGVRVVKNKLEPDPETAPTIREYFKRRASGEPRNQILSDFNSRGIMAKRGAPWRASSCVYVERNIDTYLGHTIWNRHAERLDGEYVGGKKFRPGSDWVVTRSTHEPLISPEEAEAIRKLWRPAVPGTSRPRTSDYLLSGVLRCAVCGERMTGGGGFYICAGQKRLDGHKCRVAKVSKDGLERGILRLIRDAFSRPNFQSEIVRRAKAHVRAMKGTGEDKGRHLREAIGKAERARARWIATYESEGPGWQSAPERIEALTREIDGLGRKVAEIEGVNRLSSGVAFTDSHLRDLLARFDESAHRASIQTRRALVQEVIERIDMGPKEQSQAGSWERNVNIFMRLPLTEVELASPGGFEPPLPA